MVTRAVSRYLMSSLTGSGALTWLRLLKDLANGCFISSLVLCRRAYEGALVELYRKIEGKDPIEDAKCKKCKNVVRRGYMGISKLHNWAINNQFVSEKLKQLGFLVTDLGAGGAHPPLHLFPRDKEMAELGITATLALLKQIAKAGQK